MFHSIANETNHIRVFLSANRGTEKIIETLLLRRWNRKVPRVHMLCMCIEEIIYHYIRHGVCIVRCQIDKFNLMKTFCFHSTAWRKPGIEWTWCTYVFQPFSMEYTGVKNTSVWNLYIYNFKWEPISMKATKKLKT